MELLKENDFRKPFVRFERVAVENKEKSLAAGHYVADDVDMVFITPPFTKDIIKNKVTSWFKKLEQDVHNQRIPVEWVHDYKKAYDYWLRGQELPLEGTPIKGWGLISPAQQETLIKMHVFTVEQAANMNDEGARRYGMGGIDIRNKAQSWLKTLNKSGKTAMELAELRTENERLKTNLELLTSKVEQLTAALNTANQLDAPQKNNVINIQDLLDESVDAG